MTALRERPRPRTHQLVAAPVPPVERWRPGPQLSSRAGVVAGVVLVAFAALFLRLWALQVLSGSQYLNAGQNNQLRTFRLPAPRGPIVDRNGNVLVGNTVGNSIQLWPTDLPRGKEE